MLVNVNLVFSWTMQSILKIGLVIERLIWNFLYHQMILVRQKKHKQTK